VSLSNAAESIHQPTSSPTPSLPETTVRCEDRWQVYHRLQELEIDCQCSGFQPLKVQIQTPTAALQLWSIVRRVSEPRQVLVDALNQSWQRPCAK
jgi:hypothetical protein